MNTNISGFAPVIKPSADKTGSVPVIKSAPVIKPSADKTGSVPVIKSAPVQQETVAPKGTVVAMTTSHTGVKSVEEQQADTKADEEKKAKADVENKVSDSTTTQSAFASKQIIASNLESLKAKPETNTSTAGTLPKPVDTWKTRTNAITDPSTQTGNSLNSANQMPFGKELQAQMQHDAATVANNFGLSTPDQNQNSSSQQSSSTSPQMNGGGPSGPGGSGYYNNTTNIIGNNSGNTTVIGGGETMNGGSGVINGEAPQQALPEEPPAEKPSNNGSF